MARSTRTRAPEQDPTTNEDAVEATSDDTEAPASGRRSRRGGSDDSNEDRETKRRRATASGGWGEFKKTREATKSSKFADIWKPSETETLVKFLDDAPFASYGLHWFDEIAKGRKGFECIKGIEGDGYGKKNECPACDLLNDNPKLNALFNVVVFDTTDPDSSSYGEFSVKVLKCGVTLTEQLQGLAESERTGPLTKLYWEITASGKGGSYSANCAPIKERDVVEDWEIEPLTEDDLDTARKSAFGPEYVEYPTLSELKKIVESIL